jgi:hypothetical protein
MVLEHVRRLDGVVVNADQDQVFFVHVRSLSIESIGRAVPTQLRRTAAWRQDHYFENYLLVKRESTSSTACSESRRPDQALRQIARLPAFERQHHEANAGLPKKI